MSSPTSRGALAVTALAVAGLATLALAQDAPPKDAREAAPKARVLLISIDALRPEAYLEERFPTPNLKALVKAGIAARKVTGVFPTLTYPAHTSIATGCRPARHGVVHNTIFNALDGGKKWYYAVENIRCVPLWDAAKRAGLKTSCVRWPVTIGAKIDWHLPEIFTSEPKGDSWALVKQHGTPGLFESLKLEPPEQGSGEPGIDEVAATATARIIETHKPELVMLHLVQADGAQHSNGREHEDVLKAFGKVDEHVGRLVKSLETAGVEKETAVIITGDHGFLDVHTAVRPNALLREAGLVKADEKGKLLDWTALAHTGGGAAAIYLRDPSDKDQSERVIAVLRSAATRLKGVFRVLDRDALDKEEAFPGALCGLECEPGFGFDGSAHGDALVPAFNKGTHGYLPHRDELATGFIAAGPGLAKGRVVPSLRQIDIAPLAAHLMGVELGPAVQGRLIPGLLARPESKSH